MSSFESLQAQLLAALEGRGEPPSFDVIANLISRKLKKIRDSSDISKAQSLLDLAIQCPGLLNEDQISRMNNLIGKSAVKRDKAQHLVEEQYAAEAEQKLEEQQELEDEEDEEDESVYPDRDALEEKFVTFKSNPSVEEKTTKLHDLIKSENEKDLLKAIFFLQKLALLDPASASSYAISAEEKERLTTWAASAMTSSNPDVASALLQSCPPLARYAGSSALQHILAQSISISIDSFFGIIQTLFFSDSSLFELPEERQPQQDEMNIVIARFMVTVANADRSAPIEIFTKIIHSLVSGRREHRKSSLLSADGLLKIIQWLIQTDACDAANEDQRKKIADLLHTGRWISRPASFHRRMREVFAAYAVKFIKS